MSFLGGLIGGIAGFITGGPAGAVVGAAGGFAGSGGVSGGLTAAAGYAQRTPINPGGGGLSSSPLQTVLSYPTTRLPQNLGFAGAGPGFAVSPPAQQTGVMTAGATSDAPTGAALAACDIKGHHLNRSTYFTHSFGLFHKHEKGSTCVKNRRMNVGNARALRHALRRARGFEKLAMRTIRILHPTKRGRFAGFKTRARSRR